ncbi:MAG: hypothetical protein AVO35_11425 [Candidatus Aegiribacteria sp. MLS_C]|nr:MAG: hypothetical protein AVO35_11425 [Candidatus Aegiribacteria sp. MLS_C]
MKYISLLLHVYQPPTQDIRLVERIDRECYRPLSGLLASSGHGVGLNICYSLTEHLERLGSPTLERLSSAVDLEFTDSGAYHPIFPLVDREDVVRQLRLNREGNSRVLGSVYAPSGVFPPEMAYSEALPAVFRSLGYCWTVTDDLPWASSGRKVPCDSIPVSRGVSVLLRSNFWSNRISFHGEDGSKTADEILSGMRKWTGEGDAYLLIAMDGETFGHHRRGAVENFLAPFLERIEVNPDMELVTPGRLPDIFPELPVPVPSGSWSTTAPDMARGVPWPLWDDPDNRIHAHLWKLLREVRAAARSCTSERVAKHADKMLYSCPFWWASEGRFDALQVRRGLMAVLETARAVYDETGDRGMLDSALTSAFTVPVVTGEDIADAQEG